MCPSSQAFAPKLHLLRCAVCGHGARGAFLQEQQGAVLTSLQKARFGKKACQNCLAGGSELSGVGMTSGAAAADTSSLPGAPCLLVVGDGDPVHGCGLSGSPGPLHPTDGCTACPGPGEGRKRGALSPDRIAVNPRPPSKGSTNSVGRCSVVAQRTPFSWLGAVLTLSPVTHRAASSPPPRSLVPRKLLLWPQSSVMDCVLQDTVALGEAFTVVILESV